MKRLRKHGKGITWDKDLQKAMQDTINKARAMQKGQELER